MGLLGPSNLVDLHPSIDLEFAPGWTLGLSSVFYWRQSTGDGIYDNGSNLLRDDGGSDARWIGSQYEAVLTFAPDRTFEVALAWSTLLPGTFIRNTGPDETVNFASVEMKLTF